MFQANIYEVIMQMINFIILLFILNKILYQPLMALLEKREADIQEQLNQASVNKETTEKMLVQQKEVLEKASKEAHDIRKSAEAATKNDYQANLDKAKAEAEKLLASARKEIEAEVLAARHDLTQQVADFSIALSQKILNRNLTPEDQKAIVAESLAAFKNEQPLMTASTAQTAQ
ncbi:MAG: F0F1 ATP synthase subunit B [Candidatus Margulisiibacteriota bacterium]